jgi:hypothetical protein
MFSKSSEQTTNRKFLCLIKGIYNPPPTHTHIHTASQVQWLTPVIPATQEVEIERIVVQGKYRQKS